MRYQNETMKAYHKLKPGTIAIHSHAMGMSESEPLIVAMDAMLRYAKAYKKAYDTNLADDGVLGECWLDAVKGIRGLLNGNGAVAMEKDITTDSKDNGCVEEMFWAAMDIAGFTEDDI